MNFGASSLDNVVGRLLEAPEICPNLEIIDDSCLGPASLVRAKEFIAARNRQTGGNIQFGRGRDDGVFSYNALTPPNVCFLLSFDSFSQSLLDSSAVTTRHACFASDGLYAELVLDGVPLKSSPFTCP
jgi:hypothetical protein